MALCMVVTNRELDPAQGEALMAQVGRSGPVPPEGARFVVAGPGDAGWRVVSVWDSEEARDAFIRDRLAPAYEAIGLDLRGIERTEFEVRALVAGDLTGVLQRA